MIQQCEKPCPNDNFSDFVDAMLLEGGLVVVLNQVYFDESGTHKGSEFMSFAGYVFEKRQARLFSKSWQRDLNRLGLTHAHMTDCANGNGEYKRLSLKERVDSEKLLIKQIRKRSLFGISLSIRETEYDEIMNGAPFIYSAYTLLLLLAVYKIRGYLKGLYPDGKIAYFFEAGHSKANEANKFMNGISQLGWEDHFSYAGHAFLDKKEAVPLQAADMLAWQHRHYYARLAKGYEKPRADFAALIRPQDMETHIEAGQIHLLRERMIATQEQIRKNKSGWISETMSVFR